MGIQTWQETLLVGTSDGSPKTATAAATILHTSSVYTLPANFFYVGRELKITMQGRISCAVTTPGTARFDVRLGGTVVFDSGALNLNIVAKTNVPFWVEILMTCRTIGSGTVATLFGIGTFQSEAVVGAPANTAGGNGSLICPVGAPAVGAGFDSTATKTVDVFHTQTVNTGSITVHKYKLETLN